MTYIITPQLTKLTDELKPALSTRAEPQLESCVIFADPMELIKRHPAVLSFYQGKTATLAVNDLGEFCRKLSGANSRYSDGSGAFIVGKYVLDKIPAEKQHGVVQRTFASISGKDLTQYFDESDRYTINDFLDNVMLIDKDKIVLPREFKSEAAPSI